MTQHYTEVKETNHTRTCEGCGKIVSKDKFTEPFLYDISLVARFDEDGQWYGIRICKEHSKILEKELERARHLSMDKMCKKINMEDV